MIQLQNLFKRIEGKFICYKEYHLEANDKIYSVYMYKVLDEPRVQIEEIPLKIDGEKYIFNKEGISKVGGEKVDLKWLKDLVDKAICLWSLYLDALESGDSKEANRLRHYKQYGTSELAV